jgi:uncharacterized protein (TIGR02145 family)
MKKHHFFSVLFLLIASFIQGQTIVNLIFTAEIAGVHRPLDSIYVENLTQGGDTILYGTDTVLMLEQGIGTGDLNPVCLSSLVLFPGYPNPSAGFANIRFFLPEDDLVSVRIIDLQGREHAVQRQLLKAGFHSFIFYPGKESVYLLSVETSKARQKQKLIHIDKLNISCQLDYTGWQSAAPGMRKGKSVFPWSPGDQLRFVGFAGIDATISGHDIMEDNPLQSRLYQFSLMHGIPCMDELFVTDIDGNLYRTVRIGSQCWMRKNFRATKYRNGNQIPLTTSNTGWKNATTPAYCWYNNDSANDGILYGALYNYYTLENGELCPAGWHAATNVEWKLLTNDQGGDAVAGGMLKESGPLHWGSTNTGATNASGFEALPGGSRSGNTGFFLSAANKGWWWTSTGFSAENAWNHLMNAADNDVIRTYQTKGNGFSVRCIRDDSSSVQVKPSAGFTESDTIVLLSDTVIFTDLSVNAPILWQWDFGDGNFSFVPNPTHVYASAGTYTVKLIVSNVAGTDTMVKLHRIIVTPNGTGYPVYDFDGNGYDTVHIGSQVWLKQNLRTTRYNNGNSIPIVTDDLTWTIAQGGYMCWYMNNQALYGQTYGALYNYPLAIANQLCPTNYHVPSQAEFDQLESFLGGAAVAGGKLKSTTLWSIPNTGATNSSGFTALPAGFRDGGSGFGGLMSQGIFWTTTSAGSGMSVVKSVMYNQSVSYTSSYFLAWGFSVRCLKD